MESGIGEIIFRLREESGLTLSQLSQGLCSISQLTKMERNQLTMDYFVLDRLFTRMGKSTEQLEYVLPLESYELYKLQYLIQKSICQRKFEEAEELLTEYESKKQSDKVLHRQYIYQERAQIGWMQGKSLEEILRFINIAIEQTMPLEGAVKSGMALSAEEIKLLLFRWEVCLGTHLDRGSEELRELFEYINYKKMESVELVRVFPYAVLLQDMGAEKRMDNTLLEVITKRALSLLREEGKLLYMTEILEQYANLLEKRQGDGAFIETLRREARSLQTVEEEFQVSFEKYRLFQHTVRRFELDYELIRKTRMAAGLTQEELSEGICTQETLSRIESGGRSPRDTNMYEMMERMNRGRRRVSAMITTEEYEVLQIKKQFTRAVHRLEYAKAEKIVDKLERRLDCRLKDNRQYLETQRVKILYHKKECDWEACIEKLQNTLNITLDWEKSQGIGYELTASETNILNFMALIYYENQKKEKALRILELLAEKFQKNGVKPVHHLLDWELVVGNLAQMLAEGHQEAAAIELSERKIGVSITAGNGNGIGRSLIEVADALEKQGNEDCVYYYECGLNLLKLFKMEFRYRLIVDYVNAPEFPYKERLKQYQRQGVCLFLKSE